MLFGACYNPEYFKETEWEKDLDLMAEANMNCLRFGEFAWCKWEPNEGEYNFEWAIRFNELASKRGIQLLICPPIRTLPIWLIKKYPDMKITRDDGVVLEYGSRYSFCINHPVLIEKGIRLASEMGKVFGKEKNIFGWHLDNEHGDEPDCHCDICRQKFQRWCEKKYESIEELNDKWGLMFWGLEYQRFSEILTPKVTKAIYSPGFLLAWKRFRSECTVSLVKRQAKIIRPLISKEQAITTNNQPGYKNRTNYYDMAKHLDIVGTNYYPDYGDGVDTYGIFNGVSLAASRSYKNGKGFHVHELRNSAHMTPGKPCNSPQPGEVAKTTMHCIGNGANGIFYFSLRAFPYGNEQSHGTLISYNQKPKREFYEVKKIGAFLKDQNDRFDQIEIKSEVAVLYDFPTRWVMEQTSMWVGKADLFMTQLSEVYRGIREAGLNCNLVSREQDFEKFKVLVITALGTMDDDLAYKIEQYVKNGGTLILHPLSGTKDNDSRIYPDRIHPVLHDLIGADLDEFATSAEEVPNEISWNTKKYEVNYFYDLPVATNAKVVGQFKKDWFNDHPAILHNAVGQGEVYYIASYPKKIFYTDLIGSFVEKNIIKQSVLFELPEKVEVVVQENNDGEKQYFILSTSKESIEIQVKEPMQDIFNKQKINGSLILKPFGVAVLI